MLAFCRSLLSVHLCSTQPAPILKAPGSAGGLILNRRADAQDCAHSSDRPITPVGSNIWRLGIQSKQTRSQWRIDVTEALDQTLSDASLVEPAVSPPATPHKACHASLRDGARRGAGHRAPRDEKGNREARQRQWRQIGSGADPGGCGDLVDQDLGLGGALFTWDPLGAGSRAVTIVHICAGGLS